MTTTQLYRPSRSDVVGMWMFLGVGAVIAVWAVIAAIVRISEVLSNRDVQVAAEFSGTIAQAPIGPDGALLPVVLDQAFVTVESLSTFSLVALVIQQVVAALTVVIVIVCLVVLSWSVMRGRVFSRRNTRLVTTAGLTGLVGFAVVPYFGNMAANDAFAGLSDGTFDNVVMAVDPAPLILIAFIAAMAAVVFATGDRMRRDTEGLV